MCACRLLLYTSIADNLFCVYLRYMYHPGCTTYNIFVSTSDICTTPGVPHTTFLCLPQIYVPHNFFVSTSDICTTYNFFVFRLLRLSKYTTVKRAVKVNMILFICIFVEQVSNNLINKPFLLDFICFTRIHFKL